MTIVPPPALIIVGATAWVRKNADLTLTAAERDGDLAADVARGTSDERGLVLKSSCHGSDARHVFLD